MHACWEYSLKVCLGIVAACTVITAIGKDACFMKLCVCSNDNRFVQCNNLNLTYFPALPKTTKVLRFEGNFIPRLTQSVLLNLTHLPLTSLFLKYNHIRHIDQNFFEILRKMKILNLSHNELSRESLYSLFTTNVHSKLQSLELRGVGLTDIPSDICRDFQANNFRILDLSHNKLTALNMSVFRQIKYFGKIIANHNRIHTFVPEEGKFMNTISLIGNKIQDIPNFCPGVTLYPRLWKLYFGNNSITEIDPKNINCLKSLQRVDLSKNYIATISPGSFQEFPRLTWLDISTQRNQMRLHISSRAFNNSNLLSLYLFKNLLTLSDIEQGAFDGCSGLEILNLQNNYFYLNEDKLNGLLYSLTNLRQLDIFSTQIRKVPSVIGIRLHKLKTLEMGNNVIKSWKRDQFVNLTKLTTLYISRNSIEKINRDMFPNYLEKRLKAIRISQNPFVCDCELVWFIQWVHSDPTKFFDYKEIKCINITERICLRNSIAYKSTSSVICVFFIILLVGSLLYKHWWNIKYYIYMIRYRPMQQKYFAEKPFIYDLFVSYCVSDEHWVLDKLLPVMEEGEQLRLCVHQRDFEGGNMIIDNIIHHMENSRKTLVVLSNDFAGSEWCQFEVSLAQRLVLDLSIEAIVVVLLEDIVAQNMTKSMHALLQTNTYIKWDDDQDEDTLWRRLKTSLNQ